MLSFVRTTFADKLVYCAKRVCLDVTDDPELSGNLLGTMENVNRPSLIAKVVGTCILKTMEAQWN